MRPVPCRVSEKVLFRGCLNSAFFFLRSLRISVCCHGKSGLFVEFGYQPDVQLRGEDDGHLFPPGDDC